MKSASIFWNCITRNTNDIILAMHALDVFTNKRSCRFDLGRIALGCVGRTKMQLEKCPGLRFSSSWRVVFSTRAQSEG